MGVKTKIVIVDDHRILREGLLSLLNRQEDFEVVGDAGDGHGALASVEQTVPDVLILDIHLPGEGGLQIARKVLAVRPGIKVVILSASSDKTLVNEALRAGAVGFLSKEEAAHELVLAIHTVMSGQVYLSPIAATSLVEHLKTQPPTPAPPGKPAFSGRELAVLKMVVEGLRNKEIADRLGIGVKSVESYRARVAAKAGCSSPAELVRYALREKLVNP